MIDIATEKQHLLEEIVQHTDPRHQAGMLMVTRTQLKVYGVKAPYLRQIARDWKRAHEDIPQEDLLALLEALWEGESQEERALAMELLERYHRRIPDLTWAHFDSWRRKVDNWGLTDKLGVYILGRWLLSDPDARVNHLWDLIEDENVWSQRLALVGTV